MSTTTTRQGSADYFSLNAMINLYDNEGKIQLDKDKEAVRSYFLNHVNLNTAFFHSIEEKLKYLVEEGYYESEVLDMYSSDFLKDAFKFAYSKKFRFSNFLGAFKYYTGYTLKTWDGDRYLERFEDRVVMVALLLAKGNEMLALNIIEEIISGRYQPATPTFASAGKKARGELVSCFLLRVEDNMESISRAVNSSLQLSKRGGGVALSLSNLREKGSPIKGIENQSSGVVPVMKMLEDAFSYANQLGSRQGAGAVYLNVHHPDILDFLDTKRENADEKVRIKTLSIGLVVPDVTFELARKNADMYLFSPYDVEREYGVPFGDISITEKYKEMVDNPKIKKKKIKARALFEQIAEIQFESGYPYLMFEDTVNEANPIDGRINMSNLCLVGDTKVEISNFEDGRNSTVVDLGELDMMWNMDYFASGIYIKSFKDGNQIWTPVSNSKLTGYTSDLISIEDENGNTVICTHEHMIMTQRGWVQAQHLEESDTIVSAN